MDQVIIVILLATYIVLPVTIPQSKKKKKRIGAQK